MIRPTFLAFETAKKAINVSRAGLDTVGHNISNANTPGFTRQRTDQVSLSMAAWSEKYRIYGTPVPGMGSDVTGISQIRDPYLDNRYRAEATNNGELSVKSDGLLDINNIFDEIMTDGLHYKMGELLNAIDIFSQEADSADLGLVVRNMATEFARMLNKNAAQLEDARTQIISDVQSTVSDKVNGIIEKIASLNKQIRQDNFYGNPSNELNDERNMLIDQLSEYLDINVVRTPQEVAGRTVEYVSIELKNTGDPVNKIPNFKIVEGSQFSHLQASVVPEPLEGQEAYYAANGLVAGNIKIAVVDPYSGKEIDVTGVWDEKESGDITQNIYKGTLKGYIDIINGQGPPADAGVSSFKGIPYYQKSLDEFAQKLAEVFNRINNVSPQEAESQTQISATSDKNLFVPIELDFSPANTAETNWIDSIDAGSREFSGKIYNMSFTYATEYDPATGTPGVITAEYTDSDGNTFTYEGAYLPGQKVDFYVTGSPSPYDLETDTVAFTITTTDKAPPTPAQVPGGVINVDIDGRITAANIAVSGSWADDPLYMTTTKKDPVTKVRPELTLSGNNNPTWLKGVSYADIESGTDDGGTSDFNIPNGTYTFSYNETSKMLSVTISGVEYTAEYKTNSTLELKNAAGDIGLTVSTNNLTPKADDPVTGPATSNSMTLRNITGAAADNLNKLKTEIRATNYYSNRGVSESFQQFLSSFQEEMAAEESYNNSLLDTSTQVIADLADRRDSVSAVSMDEEGVNLMTYQSHYNAAARYMTALDEALDRIINGMGRVGM